MSLLLPLCFWFAFACTCPKAPAPSAEGGTTVQVTNDTTDATVVYVAFGSNSVVLPDDLKGFCDKTGSLTCVGKLAGKTSAALPLNGRYLNATFSFDAPVGCGVTKAELNVNNPNWFDVMDVSLVDGFSNKIKITADTTVLEPVGATGNEKALGVFPLGCDICVARQSPPCGMKKGHDGCKTGSQYNPDVPCQWQGPVRGGGSSVTVALVK